MLAIVAIAGPTLATAQDFEGPARERPLPDDQLLEFMDAAGQAMALARRCPDAFDADDASIVALAHRWGRSVSASPGYDIRLSLTALSLEAERAQAIAELDCADAATTRYIDSFQPFIDAAPATVRRSEIR
ncbi:MAG: hypothetical protein AAF684_10875 [Pseudomonadota bacterium]